MTALVKKKSADMINVTIIEHGRLHNYVSN